MGTKIKKHFSLFLVLLMTATLWGCAGAPELEEYLGNELETILQEDMYSDEAWQEDNTEDFSESESIKEEEESLPALDENGWYYSAEDVGLFLNLYGRLPENFITKSEAKELGWTGGSVENYKYGYAIGGDKFGNREGLLPKADGRQYYECDIDTHGKGSRGTKRIVFSNDGLVYYTEDHYASFILLYGEE